jgi:hypothetical protein
MLIYFKTRSEMDWVRRLCFKRAGVMAVAYECSMEPRIGVY